MAFLSINNVTVKGISACVPSFIDENINYSLKKEELEKLIKAIGVERKRIADEYTCTSDLCVKAAEVLIDELKWDRKDIDCVVFVSQTPDYRLPATSCIIQNRLGLTEDCYTLDISLGCSGYVYGLSVVASLLSTGAVKKALLLVGDTLSKITSRNDKTSWPLFGDAGTATAIEFESGANGLKFHLATDGDGKDAIIVNDGGYRNPMSEKSLANINYGEGISRRNLDLYLDGMDVFSFAVSKVPKSINKLLEKFDIDQDAISYYTFHQANLFLNETIRKKMKLSSEKVPYSLKNFGNTSSASIPLTMVTEIREELISKKLNHVSCGFGVGLSWGSSFFTTDHIVCPPLIRY